jgi:hypothetical protein
MDGTHWIRNSGVRRVLRITGLVLGVLSVASLGLGLWLVIVVPDEPGSLFGDIGESFVLLGAIGLGATILLSLAGRLRRR